MTVSSSTTKVSFSANGSTHQFAYSFKIFANADLEVIVRTSAGTETVQTLNTNYIVTNAGNDSGGNILFKYNTGNSGDAHYDGSTDHRPANGTTVIINRKLTLTQGTDYIENDPFSSTDHENALDRLTFIAQQLQEQIDRSIKASVGNTLTGSTFTLSATDRADKVFSFDSSGNLSITQELGTFKGNWATSTAYTVRDLVKDTSTNNIFIVNTAHTSSGSQPLTTNANSAKYTLIVDAASATTSQNAAAASATAAASSETDAQTAQAASETARDASVTAKNSSETALATFQGQYHGAASSDPSSNLDTGDLYFNTSSGVKVYTGSAWEDVKPTSSEQTNINSVASNASNINTVAGKASLITSDFSSGMSLVTSDFVSDVNTLAVTDVINDINLLATSDIVSDLNTLATSDIVSDINTLATSDIVSDLNTLATSDIVSDINTLATSDIVTDLNLLGTSDFVSDLNTMATTTNVNNLATVVSNISGVNSFAERYRVGSSNPSSDNDAGDLFFNTTSNELVAFNGSSYQSTAPSASSQTNINIVAGEITAQEDLGSIANSVATSSGNSISTVANAIANVTALGTSTNITNMAALNASGVVSNIASVAGAVSNVNTVATNLSGINDFADRYRIGSSNPSSNNDAGDLFYNTSTNALAYFNGTSFIPVVAGAMTSLAVDSTPQLGGNLDVNGNSIVSASNGDITIAPNGSGEINLNGTVNTDNLTIDFGSIA